MPEKSYYVNFIKIKVPSGDYLEYLFSVNPSYYGKNEIIVRISGTLAAEINSNFIDHPQPVSVAAKAVQLYLKGKIPTNVLINDHIFLSSHYYPGIPNPPEIIENYSEFQVEVPKPPLGFPK